MYLKKIESKELRIKKEKRERKQQIQKKRSEEKKLKMMVYNNEKGRRNQSKIFKLC